MAALRLNRREYRLLLIRREDLDDRGQEAYDDAVGGSNSGSGVPQGAAENVVNVVSTQTVESSSLQGGVKNKSELKVSLLDQILSFCVFAMISCRIERLWTWTNAFWGDFVCQCRSA
jgi:hypothetical protein